MIGVFGYSDEDGTEAVDLPGKLSDAVIAERVGRVSALAEELIAQRAEDRIGESVQVLIESLDEDGRPIGRALHQGPDVDGSTQIVDFAAADPARLVGTIVSAEVIDSDGADLIAKALP